MVMHFIGMCGKTLAEFARDEAGPTATEYAILLALIVVGSLVIIQSIGESFRDIYTMIVAKIPGA